jgi:hypothetical protein
VCETAPQRITVKAMDVTKLDIDSAWMQDVLLELLRIPSPTGRTDVVMQHVGERLEEIGLPFELTRRGAMIGTIEGEDDALDRAVIVHSDTIGCMVQALKDNGRLAIVPVGTHSSRFSEGTRVSVFTDDPEYTCTGTANQRWVIAADGASLKISAKHSGLSLAVGGDGLVIQQTDTGAGSQRWRATAN